MSGRHHSRPTGADEDRECQDIRETLSRIGDKWSVHVIGSLIEGPMRYNRLRRAVSGISQRMLTLTLRLLERDGLVKRDVLHTAPPTVEYQLTALGETLIEPIRALSHWAREYRHEIRDARSSFDSRSG
ncbi:winged helix-turn-helix transcriptional regulator [Sphingomonas cavernae]|uniref:Transcriptional regulator n=1 Tax=Sphingomonas cavernae TaxID=2320861 RepID=A0A418WKU4_9SPHN|nr:helix-turn-helix domain-containing protein [Sphingomonas cavernae]RJF90643.1 transcriptional regulator [Sphingomonas cavernae]